MLLLGILKCSEWRFFFIGVVQMTAVSYKRRKICERERGDKSVTLLSKLPFHSVPETNVSSPLRSWETKKKKDDGFQRVQSKGNSRRSFPDEMKVSVFIRFKVAHQVSRRSDKMVNDKSTEVIRVCPKCIILLSSYSCIND